jgi:site-specific DNA recombinase
MAQRSRASNASREALEPHGGADRSPQPAYLGEIYFRGVYHRAPHPPLVDRDTFDVAHQLLEARGEDYSHRASNGSGYLLAGLIVCDQCGKRYVGTSARGNRYRYRYYTCFSRSRYGTATCPAERLPADQLEPAVVDALLETYRRHDLIDRALAAGRDRAALIRRQLEDELAVVEAELVKTEAAIERYLLAFEAGSLPEAVCGGRVRRLGAKAAELRTRRAELEYAALNAETPTITRKALDKVRRRVADTIATGAPEAKKALLQALVAEIRVEDRKAVRPFFRVPTEPAIADAPDQQGKVRTPSGSVPPAGLEPAHRAPEARALSSELRGLVLRAPPEGDGRRIPMVATSVDPAAGPPVRQSPATGHP